MSFQICMTVMCRFKKLADFAYTVKVYGVQVYGQKKKRLKIYFINPFLARGFFCCCCWFVCFLIASHCQQFSQNFHDSQNILL